VWEEAYTIDKKAALQMLLYIRDKNNGAWRRDFTRVCLAWLKENDEDTFNKMCLDVVLIWRWDDIFFNENIINGHVLSIIKTHLDNWDTLLKKWLPRENSNPTLARFIAKGIWMTMKEYRIACKGDPKFINTLYRPITSYVINPSI
jgi:hypothetical protein